MKLNKLVIAVIVVATATLSGCVVVPPRAAYVGPGVYVQPAPYYGGYEHHHHWRGY